MKDQISAGDNVRVKQSGGDLGPTLYRVKTVEGFACQIQEIRGDGTLYAAQQFDTSLLKKIS